MNIGTQIALCNNVHNQLDGLQRTKALGYWLYNTKL